MRLDKYLHMAAGLSRSRAKKAIREGRIRLDADIVKDAATQVDADTSLFLDGEPLAPPMPRYYMLNKPAGVICATRDRSHATALDLLPPDEAEGLLIAGRLDIDTTGLVLLAADGQWIHRVTSPRHKQSKVYRARLAETLAADAEKHFARGIFLKGENRRTLPAQLERLAPDEVRITLVEGRYHQVKRMFAALGNRVIALHRERIGPVALDPELAPGDYRRLTDAEIAAF